MSIRELTLETELVHCWSFCPTCQYDH